MTAAEETEDSTVGLVTIDRHGRASGSVWHTGGACVTVTGRKDHAGLRAVTDDEITLLGFTKCRACTRVDLLAEDEVLVAIADALRTCGLSGRYSGMRYGESLTAAKNVRKALNEAGVQLIAGEIRDET